MNLNRELRGICPKYLFFRVFCVVRGSLFFLYDIMLPNDWVLQGGPAVRPSVGEDLGPARTVPAYSTTSSQFRSFGRLTSVAKKAITNHEPLGGAVHLVFAWNDA